MRDDLPSRRKHLQEHAAPTVIHHPEEELTVLARWLRAGMDKGPKFWFLLGGSIVAVVVLAVVAQGLWAGSEASDEAWTELMLAKSPEDILKAAEMPGPAASWAYLQAAEARYQEAFQDLPANRDAALPLLTKAYDLFEKAYNATPDGKDAPPQRRFAKMGMARCREARGELEDAIKLYKEIVRDWPESDEGKRAAELVEVLDRPESKDFYTKFAAFKPESFNLPPRASGRSLLDLPSGHPPLGGPTIPAPGLPGLPILPSEPNTGAPTPGSGIPANPFESTPTSKSIPPPVPAPAPKS
jgi:hypothetical protein